MVLIILVVDSLAGSSQNSNWQAAKTMQVHTRNHGVFCDVTIVTLMFVCNAIPFLTRPNHTQLFIRKSVANMKIKCVM